MNRRQLLVTMAAVGLAPRIATAQSPVASPAGASFPRFDGIPVTISPDGTKVAGTDGRRTRLQILDLATGATVQSDAVDLPITLNAIVWAPDSSAVAFSLDAAIYFRDSDIYLVDAATGTLTDLTDDDPDGTDADEISISATPASGAVPLDLYPTWSPDSQSLLFARTMWSDGPGGTTLTTISRDGGEPESRFQLQETFPISVYSPMWWLENDAILLAQWMSNPDDRDNGIWRLDPDNTLTQLISGDVNTGIPGAVIADVTPDGARASAYSQLLLGQYGVNDAEGIWFDVDLTTGTFERWEPALGLSTRPTDALKEDGPGVLVAPPVFGPGGQSVAFMTRTGNGPIHVSIMEADGPSNIIATFEPTQADGAGRSIGYRLDWADSGDLLILTPENAPQLLQP
ncbi:MAG TPA: hypothetical protein VNZ58_12705 [Thermomicrobiales bacterium]|nr:hypothetical protein [Thermomicrobiales bacterium]